MKKGISLVLVLIGIVIISSCSKDQIVNNKLEGKWKVISITDVDMFNLDMTTEYRECSKKNAPCGGKTTIVDSTPGFEGTIEVDFDFEVSDKGTKITQTTMSFSNDTSSFECTDNCTTVYTIVGREKNEMIFEHTNDSGKVISTIIQRL